MTVRPGLSDGPAWRGDKARLAANLWKPIAR